MSTVYPSPMIFLGIESIEEGFGARHHMPEFDMKDDVMISGVKAELQYVNEYFNLIDCAEREKKSDYMSLETLLHYLI